MSAYYNEIDPYAVQWLRNLIAAGHIADGFVDDRSIKEVQPSDLDGFTQCHFFAGIGVWSYALQQAGWPDDRQVWTGSCPCQPFSIAGQGKGINDERHLWPEFYRLIEECEPATVFGEQVASKDGLAWLDLVQTDLENSDYAFAATDLCAAGIGAPHIRQRLYWLADAAKRRRKRESDTKRLRVFGEVVGKATKRIEPSYFGAGVCTQPLATNSFWRSVDWLGCRDGKFRAVEPGTFPLAHGAPARVGRLRAYGNAIVAPQAVEFISAAMECLP